MPLIQALFLAFFAVLFLQSGIDKVTDWKGNLGWLKGHFDKSPFGGIVTLLLGVITCTELLAGLACAVGIVEVLYWPSNVIAQLGLFFCLLNLLMLFIGQRIAKDYAGAAVLVNYFVLAVISLLSFQ